MEQKTLNQLYQKMIQIESTLQKMKCYLDEDFELSASAKKALKRARETPESEYISFK